MQGGGFRVLFWGISASDMLVHVPIRAAGDPTAPKLRCVERRAAPAPLQWHTRACAVRGGARGVHTAPRVAVKRDGRQTHTPPTAPHYE